MTDRPKPLFKWPTSAEEIKAKYEGILQETRAAYEAIAKLPDAEISYENVILPLLCPPNFKTNKAVCESKFLQHCSTDASLREAAQEAGTALSKERISLRMRGDVYAKVKLFAESDECLGLDETRQWFVGRVLSDFARSGLGLEENQRKKLEDLLAKDAELCSSFGSNIANDKTIVKFSVEQLEGVPEAFITSHKNKEGEVEVTLKGPDVLPIIQDCQIAATRRKMMAAKDNAYSNNLDLMQQGAKIRKELSGILGYSSYADYVTENRMTGKCSVVTEFLTALQEKVKESGKRDLANLIKIKEAHLKSRGEEFDGKLNAWDVSFYDNLMRKEQHGVDQNAIKEYFPLPHVVEGTLQVYQELLGLVFTELKDFDTWHPDVRLYCVEDAATQEVIGHFYLDLHPRPGKYSHAAIFHLLKRTPQHPPIDCMLANLNGPSPDGTPALLNHSEVETFFHEFGHIMHSLCAEGDYNMTRHAKCPRDFVEAPSQMLENWCWQPEILAKLSSHYKTKSPFPQEMLDKLVAAKHVNVSLFTLRQVWLATMDITIHTEAPDDLQKLADESRFSISLIENPPNANMLRSFGHLMNQYAAAYYGYLWSEVLSADMFGSRFAEEGIMNKETGMAYRKMILAPGGVGKIMDHLTKFLNRAPEQEHFLKSRGIIA